MAYLIYWILLTVACVEARFNNPILSDQPYSSPTALKFNGTYYMLSSVVLTKNGIFPIHTSTDLMEWKLAGHVFEMSNIPGWAHDHSFYAPDIHKIGPNYLAYFWTLTIDLSYTIGVAIAEHPLGPYALTDEPLLGPSDGSLTEPTVINDEGELYLMWSTGFHEIKARKLNSDGLTFSSDQTVTLVELSLDWEDQFIYSPWYVRRGSYHYILYSGQVFCGSVNVGVARSSQALGPYEKLSEPIIRQNNNYSCTSYTSVAKDLDEKSDIVFFNAYQISGADPVWSVLLANLSWDSDEWPYIEDF